MITLPHRFEFLSDAWLEEAKKFLDRECKNRKEQFAGRPFSVSERFTNTPPHLKFEGDVASWNMRYDGENVAVARGFNDGADLIVEGDYQAALTAAQFVGVLAPGAMASMGREVATMFGKDALRVSGSLKGQHANELLMLLHDHMGRRTVGESRPRTSRRAPAPYRQDSRDGGAGLHDYRARHLAAIRRPSTRRDPARATAPSNLLDELDALSRARIRATDPKPVVDDAHRCIARARRCYRQL